MKPALILAACILPLCGCATRDDYPRLLPTDAILAEPVLPDHVPAAATPATVRAEPLSRAEALRRRAEALRGPVIEPGILSRMDGRNRLP